MNPKCLEEAKKIASDVKRGMKNIKKTQVVLCPPFIYIPAISNTASTSIFVGAQDAFYEPLGAHTGEVSFSQLPQFKVSHCLVGHSERRARGESDEIINKKVTAVVSDGMTVVLCVGEKTRDAHGDYLSFVRGQIMADLRDVSKKSLDHLVIAYEPVWAIGASESMAGRDIHEMAIYIKKVLREIYGLPADGVKILYGGSVNVENISDIMKNGVDGVLVGRDSLDGKRFGEIIKAVEESK